MGASGRRADAGQRARDGVARECACSHFSAVRLNVGFAPSAAAGCASPSSSLVSPPCYESYFELARSPNFLAIRILTTIEHGSRTLTSATRSELALRPAALERTDEQ